MKCTLLSVVLLVAAGLFVAEAYRAVSTSAQAGPPEQWYTQRLDHFNGQETRTWKQRYFVNDTFWDPAAPGPIFCTSCLSLLYFG
jgi:hypothetical protein